MNRRRNRLFSYYSPPRVQMQAVRRAGQPAFMPRSANTAGAEASMGIDALCICCSLRKDSTARQGGRGCRLSLPTRRASPPRPLGRKRVLWEAMRLVWAVACVRTAPRRRRACNRVQPGGPARNHAPPCGRRGVLWEAMRFIMRGDFYGKSRAGGAKRVQAQPANPRRGKSYGKQCVFYNARGFY